MSDTSPVLSLPLIQPAQAQKHVTHNEALRLLDAVVQLVVIAADQTGPPAAPQVGDRYIVAAPGSNAWAGHEDEVAVYEDGMWRFVTPQIGWRAEVLNPRAAVTFEAGAGWQVPPTATIETTPQLGINAAADATNRLSLSAPATLFNHEGAGHQLKLNKAATGDTASLLYQTGFSGRAEMGLAGDDDFIIKVSADGATWVDALRLNASTGVARGAMVAGLVGSVSETAGAPTGAMIERGSNANGEYVRFADGTQICTTEVNNIDIDIAAGAIYRSNFGTRTFPMPFASGSIVCGSGASSNTINIWVNGRAANETQWAYTAFSHATRANDIIVLSAIGRWF